MCVCVCGFCVWRVFEYELGVWVDFVFGVCGWVSGVWMYDQWPCAFQSLWSFVLKVRLKNAFQDR